MRAVGNSGIYKALMDDFVWSYSRITCFDECPYRFFLKYFYDAKESPRFFATYGSFIHKLIEKFYRGELPRSDLLLEYLRGFSENITGTRPKENVVENYIRGGAEYFRNFQPLKYELVGIEKQLDFDIDGLKFVGYVDYLGKDDDGGLVVVDNKSRAMKPRSKRAKPTLKDKELDAMLRQLYLYSIGIKREFGAYPKKLCFNCFRTGVFIEEDFREDACKETESWVKKTIKEIKETDDFYPNIDYFVCRYICGVSDECVYAEMSGQDRGRRH